ncbi:hypothetical protein [Propioniciclava flava]
MEVVSALLDGVVCPWTFSRAFDAVLDVPAAWRAVMSSPGLDGVRTAGSARDLEHGLDDLLAALRDEPARARLVVADALSPDQVPWLARAGVRQFHLEGQVRPGGSARAYVDESLVRSWRLLVDAQAASAAHRG